MVSGPCSKPLRNAARCWIARLPRRCHGDPGGVCCRRVSRPSKSRRSLSRNPIASRVLTSTPLRHGSSEHCTGNAQGSGGHTVDGGDGAVDVGATTTTVFCESEKRDSERLLCDKSSHSRPDDARSARSGHVYLWDYEAGNLMKQFDLSDQPIRCAHLATVTHNPFIRWMRAVHPRLRPSLVLLRLPVHHAVL